MMTDRARTLVLLRHAKAAHPERVADLDRPLTPRGHADAAAAGGWLAKQPLIPDLVLCSPSRRTRETWHGVALALGGAASAIPTLYDPKLYESGSAPGLLELITATDPGFGCALVIGHNPALSLLCALLDPVRGTDGLRTCGLAVHRVDGGWDAYAPGLAPLIASHTARA